MLFSGLFLIILLNTWLQNIHVSGKVLRLIELSVLENCADKSFGRISGKELRA
tara:strand:- start:617 stop:775 length:159 start_codon:yes stop_codon:yes gene_type:complete